MKSRLPGRVIVLLGVTLGLAGASCTQTSVPYSEVESTVDSWVWVRWEMVSEAQGVELTRAVSELNRETGVLRVAVFFSDAAAGGRSSDQLLDDGADLRLVYGSGRVLMENPGFEAQCGTPWVELVEGADDMLAQLDAPLPDDTEDSELFEPLSVIQDGHDPRDAGGSHTVAIPAHYALAASATPQLELLPAEDRTVPSSVTLDGDQLVIVADAGRLYGLLAEATGQAFPTGAQATVTWEVERLDTAPTEPEPTNIADMSCLS